MSPSTPPMSPAFIYDFGSPVPPTLMEGISLIDSESECTSRVSKARTSHRRQAARSPLRNRRAIRPALNFNAPRALNISRAHAFDRLPWIAQLDAESNFAEDLSELQVETIGPVRRRRAAQQANPKQYSGKYASSSSSSSDESSDSSDEVAVAIPAHFLGRCETPPPRQRKDTTEVQFHGLMPHY
ncbi:hypothetical protein CYLTODRAFT_410252 [Cylindrobasidium torrendii FP15055 ss-10]|uniref:Uncharacterized protein n=1 Tax=Cylindrobasidium torrendii FP15055 ss-10 TaxID=1314674 RepID=A0A0D7BEJ8_9AGAR|nr:hypothetical protein CYLTODRAFT_410252 [Cylindrobasidium torrendii FP15055 ss-10]